jgi:hypothetical protein
MKRGQLTRKALVLPSAHELAYFREIQDSDYEPVRILLGEVGTTFLDFACAASCWTKTHRAPPGGREWRCGGGWGIFGLCDGPVWAIFALLTASLVLILFSWRACRGIFRVWR